MYKKLLILLLSLAALKASGQQYMLMGRIIDQHKNPIPFASIYISNSTYGTTTNETGYYQFRLSPGTYNVVYRFVGYKEQILKVTITNSNEVRSLQMEDEKFTPQKVVTYRTRKHYTDTVADDIVARVIAKRKYYLNEVNEYSCAVYFKGVQRMVSAPKAFMGRTVQQQLELDSSGRGLLFQSESISKYDFQQPNRMKEFVTAAKSVGLNPNFSYNKSSDLQVNFYKDFFFVPGMSNHGFKSPFAKNAFKYYHYKLVGVDNENGHIIDEIQLIPKHAHSSTFNGNVYVLEGDWRIYSVDLYLTNAHNGLNFIDTIKISQQYIPIKDSVWMPVSVQYQFGGKVLGFKFDGYYNGIYNNYNLDPKFPDKHFNGEILHTDTAANTRSYAYWYQNRPVPLTREEERDLFEKDSISGIKRSKAYKDSTQHSSNTFTIIPYIPFGHTSTYRYGQDSLYFYPFVNTVFYNTVEGLGANVQAKYSHIINDRQYYDLIPDVRYGIGNKIFTANVNGDYFYDPFHNAKIFGGFGSDILDLNNVGTRSLYFNTLSTLLSGENYVKYYKAEYINGGFQREIANGILWSTSLTYADRTQLFNTSYYNLFSKTPPYTSNNPLMPNAPETDRSVLFPENQALTFFTAFRIDFDQQYMTRPTGSVYLPSKYPEVTVSYRQGINDVLGSDVKYNFASINIAQTNIPVGMYGFSSFQVTAGDYFNQGRIYFPDYYHFLGNQGTTFDPTYIGSFHFLPFYTYSTDHAFLEAHYQHDFSGALLNGITFFRKLKLDEIIGVNYLSVDNNNDYKEFYVGLQRLIFRVDYGVAYEGNKKYLQGFRIFYGIR
jgi:hypothetical protein